MADWLKKRLTPAKRADSRWADFASALEKIWELFFDPAYSRLERMRSSFRADYADLAKKMREKGDWFSLDLPPSVARQVILPWRELELDYKDMEDVLTLAFKRYFGNIESGWLPLYAPKDKPYGMEFMPPDLVYRKASEKNIPPEGWFLTSRGVLGVNLNTIYPRGILKATYMEKAIPLIKRTKPLHIVYEGMCWYIFYYINVPQFPVDAHWVRESGDKTSGWNEIPFAVYGTRFDFTPADERKLDAGHFLINEIEHEDRIPIPYTIAKWHTDFYLPAWLCDAVMPGTEGEDAPGALFGDKIWVFDLHMLHPSLLINTEKEYSPSLFYQANIENRNPVSETSWNFPYQKQILSCKTDIDQLFNVDFDAQFDTNSEKIFSFPDMTFNPDFDSGISQTIDNLQIEAFPYHRDRLDRYLCFDDCPADSFPLDMPIGGKYE